MTIKREDIDRHLVDISDVVSGRRLPPVHPGEILRDEFLVPMGISVYALAHAIKVPRSRANDIVLGRRRNYDGYGRGIEGLAAARINGVVDAVDPLDVRTEPGLAA